MNWYLVVILHACLCENAFVSYCILVRACECMWCTCMRMCM